MIKRTALLATVALTIGGTAASAQTLGIGTTKGGATAQIANALAQVISTNSDLQVIPQVSANTSQYIPLLNDGKIELAIANYPQAYFASTGTGMSSEAAENLQLVATLMPFLAGLAASEESGIDSHAAIKGHKVPRYKDNSLGDFIIRAALATGGLTYDDVESVPIANFPQQFQAFKDGKIDVSILSVGSQVGLDIEATLGDIQFLSIDEPQLSKLQELLPGAYLTEVPASETLAGLDEPATVFGYDYLLFANSDVDPGTVAQVAKAVHDGAQDLKATGPLWRAFDPATIGKPADIPYHSGAVSYFEEAGLDH